MSEVSKSDWDTAANPVLAYADSYRQMARTGTTDIGVWSIITDIERNIAPLMVDALSQLAALREELEDYRRNTAYEAEIASLSVRLNERDALIERITTLRDHHVDASVRLHAYADDADMRKSDSEHYRKRASVHRGYAATLDEVLNAECGDQVMGRVYTDNGLTHCELNSVGRMLPDDTPLYVGDPLTAQEAINRAKV